MSVAPSAVTATGSGRGRGPQARLNPQWLVLGLYLLGALAVTARLWLHPATATQPGDPHDVDLFAWFLRYDAAAVAHGHLPSLVTTALNAPEGVNAMWNTSELLPGILLAPVTLLAGPQVSLTIMVTLGFAGSAAALFLVLRRWGAGLTAAALAGAVYGFSPALLDSATGHYNLQFAVVPPLLIDALLRIVAGRGSPVRAGLWLGVLAAVQVYVAEELLADTAVAGAVVVAVLAALRPRAVPGRLRPALAGLATASVVTLAACGYPLWVQFHGPLAQHGVPWQLNRYVSHLAGFVTPPAGLLFHTGATAAAAAAYPLPEYLAYLGWPLLAVLTAAAVRFWRDLRVRFAAISFVLLEVFSFGGGGLSVGGLRIPAAALPWHWLQALPLLNDMVPDRFAIMADGLAAALLAFALDLLRPAGTGAPRWRRALPTTVAALAIAPLIPLPLQAIRVPATPAGWHTTFARLHLAAGARVLVVPVPYGHIPDAMRWQATTGTPISLIGGRCIAPGPSGAAERCLTGLTYTGRYLDTLWQGPNSAHRQAVPPSPQRLRADLAYWAPAAIVADTRPGTTLGKYLIAVFGQPDVRAGHLLAWRR